MTALQPPAALRWAAAGLYHTRLIRPLTMALGYASRVPVYQILTYHRVYDELDPFSDVVQARLFERQMAYIASTYSVLTVEELVDRAQRGRLPRTALAITFDDGYRDTLTHAAPILARYGLPATVFLTTGFIGTGRVPWYDRLVNAFRETRAASFTAPWGERLSLAGEADRVRAMDRILGYIKRRPDDDCRPTLDGILESLGAPEGSHLKDLMLSWDEVSALARMGFAIGAHTVHHPILSRVSPRRAWEEIAGSRAMIASACGRAPKAFAYPNGRPADYTHTIKELVREAGFTCAVTTRFGTNSRETCPYELRRGGPWEEHLPTYAVKLAWYQRCMG